MMHGFHGADVILITAACSQGCLLRAPGSSEMSFSGMVQTSAGPQQFAFIVPGCMAACGWVR